MSYVRHAEEGAYLQDGTRMSVPDADKGTGQAPMCDTVDAPTSQFASLAAHGNDWQAKLDRDLEQVGLDDKPIWHVAESQPKII